MSGKRKRASSPPDADQLLADWPVPPRDMDAARAFLRTAAQLKGGPLLLVPDKDADGLCAGVIMWHSLHALGASNVAVHHLERGQNVHEAAAINALAQHSPAALILLDHGSRSGPLLPGVPTLVIDHHQSTAFPDGAVVLSAYGHEPVAPTALLTWLLCQPLHPEPKSLGWLAVCGTAGDLGTNIKWQPPFPTQLADELRGGKRKHVAAAVSLINAPRRTPQHDVVPAWDTLVTARCAAEVTTAPEAKPLRACRDAINAEVARVARTPPKFNTDGSIALITITSPFQVHPLLAQRWAGTLQGRSLVAVGCANNGYLPGRVNFAMRVPARAKERAAINLVALLQVAVAGDAALAAALGSEYARGHAHATGGSVSCETWPQLLQALGFGGASGSGREGGDSSRRKDKGSGSMKITSFFGSRSSGSGKEL